jgi:TRAP-type transport system small permease protein
LTLWRSATVPRMDADKPTRADTHTDTHTDTHAATHSATHIAMHARVTAVTSTFTLGLASLLLAAMALVAMGDVAMRVAGRPVTGAYELTGLLVAAVVYAGLPGVTLADEHVRAGIFAGWVSQRPRLSAALRWLRRITTALTMGVLAWAMARYASKLAAVGDRAPFIELPLAWAAAFGAVLLALAAWLAIVARSATPQEPPA